MSRPPCSVHPGGHPGCRACTGDVTRSMPRVLIREEGTVRILAADLEELRAERDAALESARAATTERDALRKALALWGPRVCGFNCRPEDPEHERFCSAWVHNAAVAQALAATGGGT